VASVIQCPFQYQKSHTSLLEIQRSNIHSCNTTTEQHKHTQDSIVLSRLGKSLQGFQIRSTPKWTRALWRTSEGFGLTLQHCWHLLVLIIC